MEPFKCLVTGFLYFCVIALIIGAGFFLCWLFWEYTAVSMCVLIVGLAYNVGRDIRGSGMPW
jgi:hypothetical protein